MHSHIIDHALYTLIVMKTQAAFLEKQALTHKGEANRANNCIHPQRISLQAALLLPAPVNTLLFMCACQLVPHLQNYISHVEGALCCIEPSHLCICK